MDTAPAIPLLWLLPCFGDAGLGRPPVPAASGLLVRASFVASLGLPACLLGAGTRLGVEEDRTEGGGGGGLLTLRVSFAWLPRESQSGLDSPRSGGKRTLGRAAADLDGCCSRGAE